MNLSIVIFCFNEAGNIEKLLQDVFSAIPSISTCYEVIIVDDGSTDQTLQICRSFVSQYDNLILITHERNLGIGQALKTGYRNAKHEYICAIPGDGQFDINELKTIRPFDNSIYYSFYRPQTNYNLYRKALTWMNRIFNQHALGIFLRDVNWIKVYRKEQLSIVNPELTSSLIESEICAKLYKSGIVPLEVPSKYLERKHGISLGGSWTTIRKALPEILRLWWVVFKYNPSHRL